MLKVAWAGTAEVYAPGDKWMVSFFASRRAIHAFIKAVDISTDAEFGGEALSPVEGIVEKVVEVDAGPGPYSHHDYVIVVRCGKTFVRIMHVRPRVIPGDRIRVGDYIGRFIRSNCMSRKFVPHMHVEITRAIKIEDRTQNYLIHVAKEFVDFVRKNRVFASGYPVLKARVVHVSEDYTLLEPLEGGKCLSVVAARREAVIDGEVRRKTVYVGLIEIEDEHLRPVGVVKFLEASVGMVKRVFGRLAVAVNALGPYTYGLRWITRDRKWGFLRPRKAWFPYNSIVEIYAGGKKIRSLELFVGTLACIRLPGKFEDSVVYINVRPRQPKPMFTKKGYEGVLSIYSLI